MNRWEELIQWAYYLYSEDSQRGRIIMWLWDIADEEDLDIGEVFISAFEQGVLRKDMFK